MRSAGLVSVLLLAGPVTSLVPRHRALMLPKRVSPLHMVASTESTESTESTTSSLFGSLRLPDSVASLLPQAQSIVQNVAGSSARSQYASTMATRIGFFLAVAVETQRSVYQNSNLQPAAIVQTLLSVMLEGRKRSSETDVDSSAAAMVDNSANNEFWREHLFMIRELLQTELDHIDAGVYKMPYDLLPSGPAQRLQWNPLSVINQVRRYQRDQETMKVRREAGDGLEVTKTMLAGDRYPKYYLQNFHFQTDGWLSAKSAAMYDLQVEVLFLGMADAMRRQALPHIASFLKDREQSRVKYLDVASGTGRFMSFVLDNFPSLDAVASDLSPFYLAEAKRTTQRVGAKNLKFVEAAGEKLPFADGEFDMLTNVYLFHELPREVRRDVAAEMARVLKPGGKLFFVDSAQRGERSKEVDLALDGFTTHSHEPYYQDYVRDDLNALFEEAGFEVDAVENHWVTKVMVLTKQSADVAGEEWAAAVEEAAGEASAELADGAAEEAADETAEETVDETAEETAEEAGEQTAEEIAEEAVEETAEETAEDAAG